MAAKTCVFEDIPEEYAGLGGRALTSTIVAREVNPICTPLGPHNKLVFAPGLLGATNSPNGNRISVGCKSPLTEGIKESNSGGQPGGHLAKLGIMAIIVEDMATEGEWWQLELSKDSAKLVPSTVAGLNNFDAVATLVETYGDKCSYVTIGRAGEFKLTAASIAFTDRELRPMRHAGRGGVGAVMGSKGLKAIIINPEGGKNHPLADEKAFREASKRFAKALTEHPITGKGLAEYGTGVLVNILHEAGGLPTANFTVGQFDKHEGVSGETMNRLTKERGGEGAVAHGCMSGCIIRCSGLFPDKQGKFQSKWPEYETLWSFGPHSGISDIDAVSRFDYMCDDIGVDTIDVGVAVGVGREDRHAGHQRRYPPGPHHRLRYRHHRPRVRRAPRALRQGPEPARVRSSRRQGRGRDLRHHPHGRRPHRRLRRDRQHPELRRQGRSVEARRPDRTVPQPADRHGLRGLRGPVPVHRLRHPGHPGCPGRHRGHAQRQVRLAADR